jgi:hypothetical protein
MRSPTSTRRPTATLALALCCCLVGLAIDKARASPAQGPSWGAIASRSRSYGYSFNYPTRAAAELAASRQCDLRAGRPGTCAVRTYFDRNCGALAEGNFGEWGTATAQALDAAARAAGSQCDAHLPTEPCKVVVSLCSPQ